MLMISRYAGMLLKRPCFDLTPDSLSEGEGEKLLPFGEGQGA